MTKPDRQTISLYSKPMPQTRQRKRHALQNKDNHPIHQEINKLKQLFTIYPPKSSDPSHSAPCRQIQWKTKSQHTNFLTETSTRKTHTSTISQIKPYRKKIKEEKPTAMMSRSHQGMLSPPLKKEPTDSKNLLIFASIEVRSRFSEGWGSRV